MVTGYFGLALPNPQALQHLNNSVPPCLPAPVRWPVWDHEDTSRWGNQLNREAFVKLAKDPMKAMG